MSEMVERVAHALSGVVQWDEVMGHRQEHFRFLARAAIAAMREPTAKMLSAAAPAFEQVDTAIQLAWAHGFELTKHPDSSPLQRAWRAMIDSELKTEG